MILTVALDLGFICIWLVSAYLTPVPSPARGIGRKSQLLLAGEGVSI